MPHADTNSAVPAADAETPELPDDMKPAELIEVLLHLPWRGGCSTAIKIDRRVATYLTRLLQQH